MTLALRCTGAWSCDSGWTRSQPPFVAGEGAGVEAERECVEEHLGVFVWGVIEMSERGGQAEVRRQWGGCDKSRSQIGGLYFRCVCMLREL